MADTLPPLDLPTRLTIVCPLCRAPLLRAPKTWACINRHSFDVAREGYINLLPVQQKASKSPGDSAESLNARRAFLSAGHYAPLRTAVTRMLGPLAANSLLDLGCGEGWYTSAFPDISSEIIGLDIAKPAIRMAAKAYALSCPDITWLVGSGASLPVEDAALDVISCLFTQLHVDEMHRALKAGGHVLVVTPAADHLAALRGRLFDALIEHQPDKFIADFEPRFKLVGREDVRAELSLDNSSLRQLLAMTPYVWKAKPEKRAALEASPRLETTAAFSLLLFRKAE
ncbi:putative RNA methyltransferase [Nevskia sp.]|uniref:putative RNA methyltransferase n=1 Tax=Nevskia sp. TaxID=1929292 RepID=UPI0025CDE27B|nr:methyltransferase domain-containing protein [Nevskia sp.]